MWLGGYAYGFSAARYAEAEPHLAQSAEAPGGGDGEIWLALAEALDAQGKVDEAERALERSAQVRGLHQSSRIPDTRTSWKARCALATHCDSGA